MTKRPLPMTPAYMQYVRGLHRLHALTVQGLDDSPEADAVRDGMDEPWYALSEAERRRIKGLSEDLYSISDPPAEPLPNPQATGKLMEAIEALRAGDWDRALELLRRWGRHVEPAQLAYLRGTIWHEAGDNVTAALFLEHAARLDPENGLIFSHYLSTLQRSDPDAAVNRAEGILSNDGSYPPIFISDAALVLFRSALPMDPVDRVPIYQRLIGILERTIPRVPIADPERNLITKDIYIRLIIILGFCYKILEDRRAALRWFDLGLSVDPDNRALHMARGFARYGISPGAADDFSRAIQLGYPDVWPHFYLAHHNLITSRYDECLKMCDRALDYPASEEVRARLHEWRAISRSELGFPEAMVRTDFEESLRLEPENDEIRHNFDVFNRSANQPGARPHDWATPKASAIQALYRPESMFPLSPAA